MTYDAAGNMIYHADSAKSMAKQMDYDSYNRIRQVVDPSNGNIKGKYWYDDQGFRVRRVAKQEVDGEERELEVLQPSMYLGIEVQRDLLGNVIDSTGFSVSNIYLNGVRIAGLMSNLDARYYHTDQVDSVKAVTNATGLVLTSHEYMPFGEDWVTEGDDRNAPKYNSQELDKESGYLFYNARHYDPEIARFVTPDTVIDGEGSTQGWNRFAYVHNNPIRYKDPTGHEVRSAEDWESIAKKQAEEQKSNLFNNIDSAAKKNKDGYVFLLVKGTDSKQKHISRNSQAKGQQPVEHMVNNDIGLLVYKYDGKKGKAVLQEGFNLYGPDGSMGEVVEYNGKLSIDKYDKNAKVKGTGKPSEIGSFTKAMKALQKQQGNEGINVSISDAGYGPMITARDKNGNPVKNTIHASEYSDGTSVGGWGCGRIRPGKENTRYLKYMEEYIMSPQGAKNNSRMFITGF